jgi:DGQHR domain-containing protein
MKLSLPGIGYKQGGRTMVVTAMNPVALVKTVSQPDQWNPLGNQPHGNRPQDKGHREGIAQYLENVDNYVIGAAVLYVSPQEAQWEPTDTPPPGESVCPGTLHLSYGAEFDVGDGQHRIGGYSDVIQRHDSDDPLIKRLRESGQPVVIVIDDNPLNRAQDFTDLQRNAKPPSASIGLSMDRRQPINRLLINLIQDASAVPLFKGGERIEFLKDSPGKLSAKLFSYKTVRYFGGTVLIGTSQRTTSGWDKAVNAYVEANPNKAKATLTELWNGLGQIPDLADVITEKQAAAAIREYTYLASAGVLYAMAYALYLVTTEDKVKLADATKALATVSFTRPTRPFVDDDGKPQPLTKADTVFAGTLVDPDTGKVGSGRPAWEAAAQELRAAIKAAL